LSARSPSRTALLLLNVGSPDAPRTAEVRRYLAEFLDDPRVLDMPWLPRQLLLRGAILPFRPARSALAYQKIWTEAGSPLIAISRAQAEGLAARLGLPVHLAMRYGRPGLGEAIAAIQAQDIDQVVVLPLFPQYSSAATGSALQACYHAFGALPYVPALQVLPPFWSDPAVLDAYAERARAAFADEPVDHLLCSFHGLPERQIRAADRSGGCLASPGCCEAPGGRITACYKAQCHATARALGERLGLPCSVGFQSRLGRTPWIQPHSDALYAELPARGVRRIGVLCPSFVADCLETLEEVAIRGREQFLAAGGERFVCVPCPNDSPRFLDALAALVRLRLGETHDTHA